jgi:hypothetical protein
VSGGLSDAARPPLLPSAHAGVDDGVLGGAMRFSWAGLSPKGTVRIWAGSLPFVACDF